MRLRFNTADPCIPGRHYMLPALDRLPEVRRLVEDDFPQQPTWTTPTTTE